SRYARSMASIPREPTHRGTSISTSTRTNATASLAPMVSRTAKPSSSASRRRTPCHGAGARGLRDAPPPAAPTGDALLEPKPTHLLLQRLRSLGQRLGRRRHLPRQGRQLFHLRGHLLRRGRVFVGQGDQLGDEL